MKSLNNLKYIKNIIRIVIVVIILVLIGIFSLSYMITKNNDYKDNIVKRIENHYDTDYITYVNLYGNYYIFTTKDNVIVLNNEYEEILKDDIDVLAENKDNYELIYRTNKLMYEKTTLKKDRVIYTYYDAKSYKKLNSIYLER